MFPRSIMSPVTLYRRKLQIGTAPEEIERIVIEQAFWDDTKATNPKKSGHEPATTAIIYIPYTVGVRFAPADILVRGIGPEVEAVSELKGCYKVISVKDRRFGSPNKWHWEVHC